MSLKAILLAAALTAANGRGIEGKWLTDDGKAVVSLERCGASLSGRIARVLDAGPRVPSTDASNPDPRRRGRPILGLTVLYGFDARAGKWSGGTAYDPKSGSSYRASLDLNRDGSLRVTGCVLFVCRSKRWTRLP